MIFHEHCSFTRLIFHVSRYNIGPIASFEVLLGYLIHKKNIFSITYTNISRLFESQTFPLLFQISLGQLYYLFFFFFFFHQLYYPSLTFSHIFSFKHGQAKILYLYSLIKLPSLCQISEIILASCSVFAGNDTNMTDYGSLKLFHFYFRFPPGQLYYLSFIYSYFLIQTQSSQNSIFIFFD